MKLKKRKKGPDRCVICRQPLDNDGAIVGAEQISTRACGVVSVCGECVDLIQRGAPKVSCQRCGVVPLTEKEYKRQLVKANALWRCPG